MKNTLVISLALVSSLVASAARAYDDPAVAVCEFTKFQGADVTAKGYKRVAHLVGKYSVLIAYTRSVLNTAPKWSMLTCEFTIKNGAFELIQDKIIEGTKCGEGVRNCTKTHLWPGNSVEYLRTVIQPLIDMGIYPIATEDTKVSNMK